MLALFIPWGTGEENILFRTAKSFSTLWGELKSTLSERILFHVQNFDSLQRSKQEVLADRRNRHDGYGEDQEDVYQDIEEFVGDDEEEENFTLYDRDDDTTGMDIFRREVSGALESISSAIDPQRGFWARMDDSKRIVVLNSALKDQNEGVVRRGVHFRRNDDSYTAESKEWKLALKRQASNATKRDHGEESIAGINGDMGENINEDSLAPDEGAQLVRNQQTYRTWEEARDTIIEELSLNEKQRMLLVLVAAQFSNGSECSNRDQLLIYLGGEGGTGKSRVIKGIQLLMEKMGQKQKLQLSAASGAAADNIEGSTIHSSLGLMVKKKAMSKQTMQKLKLRWKEKVVLVIDEISMISLTILAEIDKNCKILKENDSLFGGIPVVILSGDFYQLPPVVGRPLYWIPNTLTGKIDETRGRRLWEMFTNIILLTEQMRQAENSELHTILKRM